jgi:ATP-dependent helicase HrpA
MIDLRYPHRHVRDHYLPPDPDAFRRAEPPTGRVIVIAPTRAACETIELACRLTIETVLERDHGAEVRELAKSGKGFGIVAATGTGKTLAIRPIAEEIAGRPLRIGVVNREREATPETPSWNVVIVTTGIARRWFQDELIAPQDTLVADEIHQTSAELELCLALGKRVGCRFIWLSATVDPTFYMEYLDSATVLETTAFDPAKAARVATRAQDPVSFLDQKFLRRVAGEQRGVAVFLPTRAEVEAAAGEVADRAPHVNTAFYHGGEPIRVIRPFLDGTAKKPFLIAMTAAGQSALNIHGLDTVVIYDARYTNVVQRGRNVLTRKHLGPNEILQMAGRVHGRVAKGEVAILTDRDIDFDSLRPVPPEFQLAGDTERVALTAAALGVDLADLELPVPLDRRAYAQAMERLTARGIIEHGRLTDYGRDVEAMPVDRPWAELLVNCDSDLLPYIAVAANVDSLHRMTRDENDLSGLLVYGSDHLTAYNVYAEAVNQWGYTDEVYGLPRHLFAEEINQWAEDRGVLVKAIEDVALGLASVFRTLEQPLPEELPHADKKVLSRFRDLVARVMPFDLAMDGETADGERVRLSNSSLCSAHGAVAGTIRYFADRFGMPRAAIEGTNIPFNLIKRYAEVSSPTIEVQGGRDAGLFVAQATEYFGFQLGRERRPLKGRFPDESAAQAREALVEALIEGRTPHPQQAAIARAAEGLDEYWRRSGGTLEVAHPESVRNALRSQVARVQCWEEFLATPLSLDPHAMVPEGVRRELEQLPSSASVLGDRVPLRYDFENGTGIVLLRLREKQARRLRPRDVPEVDRPLRFSVYRGRREVVRAHSVRELRAAVRELKEERRQHGGRRGGRSRRQRR